MNKELSHTATPWKTKISQLGRNNDLSVEVKTEKSWDYEGIAIMCFAPNDQQKIANAEHIVKCVNGFDALVGACKKAINCIGKGHSMEAVQCLTSALKLAGEGGIDEGLE